jgi:hypothetical protein
MVWLTRIDYYDNMRPMHACGVDVHLLHHLYLLVNYLCNSLTLFRHSNAERDRDITKKAVLGILIAISAPARSSWLQQGLASTWGTCPGTWCKRIEVPVLDQSVQAPGFGGR